MFRRTTRHPISLLAFALVLVTANGVAAQDVVMLRETIATGDLTRVVCNVNLSGTLNLQSEPMKPDSKPRAISMQWSSSIRYDERILALGDDGMVRRSIRQYQKLDYERTTDGKRDTFAPRPEVRRVGVMCRPKGKVPFSPDGPLTWGELDQ